MATMQSLGDAFKDALQQPWTGYMVMKATERKVAKNGSVFYRLTLSDGRELLGANVFEDRPWFAALMGGEWRAGDHFKVQGRVSSHPQFGRQMDIIQIRPVEPRDVSAGYKPESLMERAPVDLDAYWQALQQMIAELQPEPLRRTVAHLFEARGDAFRRAAAAKQAHHAYFGGLMHHTVMMAREAKALMAVADFPPLNESLVVAGILLHDLGKTAEMEIYPRTEYTEVGALLGHIQLVLGWLEHAALACQFDGPLLMHLKHIILSHHGQHEHGAAILPQTREALFVHLIDNLDSKMQMVHSALSRIPEGDSVTEKLWALDHRAFRLTPAAVDARLKLAERVETSGDARD